MYKNKHVLITGASSGIGKALAYEFAKEGANLILVARNIKKLNEISDDIKTKFNNTVSNIEMDLSKPSSAIALFHQTETLNLSIDILINNAGFGKWGDFNKVKICTYQEMLQLNINTLTELCYLYLPKMKQNEEGGIINIASNAALLPVPYAAVYSASKSYVLNFSEALHGELQDTGVTVTCVCPGGTKTNFSTVAMDSKPSSNEVLETPESVAKESLSAFKKGESYCLLGKNKKMIQAATRFLSRKRLIKLSGKSFKKVIESNMA